MAKKCCPRINVVCKKMGAESISQTYWTLKGPLAKPVQHTATVNLPARTKCAVKLGKRVVSEYVPLDSPRLDKAIARYQKSVAAQGCADTAVGEYKGVSKPDAEPKLPDVPGLVKDRLQKRVESKRRR